MILNNNSDEALREVWKTCYEFKEWAVEMQEENKRLLQVIDELKEELFFYKECYEREMLDE